MLDLNKYKNKFYDKCPNSDKPKWFNPNINQFSYKTTDNALFADDTSLSIIHNESIITKVDTYNNSAQTNNFIVNWDKVHIIIKNKLNQVKNIIQNAPPPYNKIKCSNKAKILGHIMSTSNNLNDAITDRLKKANVAWNLTRKHLLGITDININLRILLFESLVTSILTYSLHILPISKNYSRKLQQFHSKCTRLITQGYYNSEATHVSNHDIRRKYNISTLTSRLKMYRLKQYYKWKKFMSINYLNDTIYK